ncbi:MAG: hypothetical protein SFX73_09435 [Kofleriaceae bacterium]|nr:hypothetical protein [Kofleriaceae bacterium]
MTTAELATYEAWHDCITRKCRIQLTAEYVAGRIAALSDDTSSDTKVFARLYGDEHRRRVLGYFERARASMAA